MKGGASTGIPNHHQRHRGGIHHSSTYHINNRDGHVIKSTRPAAAVPKPIQTSSIKAEHGCFDLTTRLLPAGTKAGWGTASVTPVASVAEKELTIKKVESLTSKGASANASVPTSRESVVGASGNPKLALEHPEWHVWKVARQAVTVAEPRRVDEKDSFCKEFPSPHEATRLASGVGDVTSVRSMNSNSSRSSHGRQVTKSSPSSPARESPVGTPSTIMSITTERSPSPLSASPQPHLERASAWHSRPSHIDHPVTSQPPPRLAAPHIFQTPSPDDAPDDVEKDRRRRALALEQQQIILDAVRASRIQKEAPNRKSDQTAWKMGNKADQKKESQPRQSSFSNPPSRSDRGPRTKGRLFEKLPDGSLIEAEPRASDLETDKVEHPREVSTTSATSGPASSRPRNQPRQGGSQASSGASKPHSGMQQKKPSGFQEEGRGRGRRHATGRRPRKQQVAALQSS